MGVRVTSSSAAAAKGLSLFGSQAWKGRGSAIGRGSGIDRGCGIGNFGAQWPSPPAHPPVLLGWLSHPELSGAPQGGAGAELGHWGTA